MAEYILLHNPRCSKSRAAKTLLEERGIDFQIRDYQQEPLSLDELRVLKAKLGLHPAKWIRFNEDEAKGLRSDMAPMELLDAISRRPKILERPILVHGDRAAVGRPGPEALEPLLEAAQTH